MRVHHPPEALQRDGHTRYSIEKTSDEARNIATLHSGKQELQ